MEYIDDGDSESEVLGPVQESQQTLQDPSSESDEPEELPPSHHRRMQRRDSRGTSIHILPSCLQFLHVFNKFLKNLTQITWEIKIE